jgi:zinc/manganese transport system permease protein
MGLTDYLALPAVQHALIAATLVAVISGMIGPFVITRRAAFAVHGVAELSFTGAVAGLVWANDAVLGAMIGSLVVATAIGVLGVRESERDAAIGVTLAFGLGVGVYLLAAYHRNASQATNILFGQIFGVTSGQLALLLIVAGGVLVALVVMYRPLLFASVDPDVAAARGVPVRLVGLLFLGVLALTVTEAAQIVGTLLVLSLTITPAAAAHRISARPVVVAVLSVAFAVLAADGGVLASLERPDVTPSVFITGLSFVLYLVARVGGARRAMWRRTAADADDVAR